MRHSFLPGLVLGLVLLTLSVSVAQARWARIYDYALITPQEARLLAVGKAGGGEVLSWQLKQTMDTWYEVVVLTDKGQHWTVGVDARTGRILTVAIAPPVFTPEGFIPPERASILALRHTGASQARDVRLEQEGDRAWYTVEVVINGFWHLVGVDARQGTLLGIADGNAASVPWAAAQLNAETAAAVALKRIPGTVLYCGLERNEQGAAYRVLIRELQGQHIYAVWVDAFSGEVLESRRESH